MKHPKFYIYFLLFILTGTAWGQKTIFKNPLSPRIANYSMKVRLDTKNKQIAGNEILTWTNTSTDKITELQFHLYMNAFKNEKSTYFRESGGGTGINHSFNNKGFGWIDITKMEITGGKDITGRIEFIQPDDGNRDDRTVIRVPLPKPLAPGISIELDINFITKMPHCFERTGWEKDFFFAAQWFPKIGVYIDGKWNCHQFHANSEFFADFGVYDVELILPKEYVVGTSGIILSETDINEKEKKVVSRGEDIHDFAWTASPRFKKVTDRYNNTEIVFLYAPQHEDQIKSQLFALKEAMRFYGRYGEYPYPRITVVDPLFFGAGGMEYPNLITGGTIWKLPEGLRAGPMVVLHEYGHQYWYGMVASNEFEEAWLDEGINSYSELRALNEIYSENTSVIDFCGIKIGDIDFTWLSYLQGFSKSTVLRNAWDYPIGGYGVYSYKYPALFLGTMENIIGRDIWGTVMKTYFDRWKFKHPHTQDFINVVNEITGTDYSGYFDRALKTRGFTDYAVYSISSIPEYKKYGVFDSRNGKNTKYMLNNRAKAGSNYVSIVKVQRKGGNTFPVDIKVVFSDGETVTEKWNGRSLEKVFRFIRPAMLVSAEIDPERKILVDINLLNNSKIMEKDTGAAKKLGVKFLFWIQNIIEMFSFFG